MAVPVTAALAAAKAGTLGAGFSGGGFLIPFFLGVIQVLYFDLKVLSADTPVAGGSSGSIVAMAASGVVNMSALGDEVARLSAYCREHGNCYGDLQAQVVKCAERIIPSNGADVANKGGRTHLAITYPSPLGLSAATQKLVNSFSSREDLINAIASSIYIPLFAGPRLVTDFRGDMVYDGSLAGPGRGYLPCPPGVTYCVRVSAFPAGVSAASFLVNQLALGTHADKESVVDTAASTLLSPNTPAHLTNALMAYLGGEKLSVASEPGQLKQLILALLQLVTPGEGEADIWPGRRHPLPMGVAEWTMTQLRPPTPAQRQQIYDLGRAEALTWAQEAGFPAAKAFKTIRDLKRGH